MKKQIVKLGEYSGYRHNRYDGYNSTWGVLMALGASRTADCFADEDDQPDEDFDRAYNGEDAEIGNGNNDDFRETVLANLDPADIDNVEELETGESTAISQYWGQYEINIVIEKTADDKLMCVFDGFGPFEVEL